MGCTLADLQRRMTLQEFQLHLALEVKRNSDPQAAPTADELEWFGNAS
jgi:hypothetical protein